MLSFEMLSRRMSRTASRQARHAVRERNLLAFDKRDVLTHWFLGTVECVPSIKLSEASEPFRVATQQKIIIVFSRDR
jgi:hypothetical protein